MPDGAAANRVVVVEAAALGVEELPPLVAVGLPYGGAQGGVPATLAGGQVDVHALPGAGLQDLHPIRAGKKTQERQSPGQQREGKTTSDYSQSSLYGTSDFKPQNPSVPGQTLFKRPYGAGGIVCVHHTYPSVCECGERWFSSDVTSLVSRGAAGVAVCVVLTKRQVDTLGMAPGPAPGPASRPEEQHPLPAPPEKLSSASSKPSMTYRDTDWPTYTIQSNASKRRRASRQAQTQWYHELHFRESRRVLR